MSEFIYEGAAEELMEWLAEVEGVTTVDECVRAITAVFLADNELYERRGDGRFAHFERAGGSDEA